MMGRAVKSAAIAAVGIAGGAQVFRVHERADARHLTLVGERQQVEHQFNMVLERFRRSYRRFRNILISAALRIAIEHSLDSPLDLANVVEVSVEPHSIGWRQSLLKSNRLFDDGIQNTAVFALPREALL